MINQIIIDGTAETPCVIGNPLKYQTVTFNINNDGMKFPVLTIDSAFEQGKKLTDSVKVRVFGRIGKYYGETYVFADHIEELE